ncbi:MAG: hypothetical protein M1275_03955, partial [Patescibacteria group bacterium]|nr:hypothetical protein [Patescibacteria group bacterium]
SGNQVFVVDTSSPSTNSGIDITAGVSQAANLLNFYSSGGTLLSAFSAYGALYMNISTTTALNVQDGFGNTVLNVNTLDRLLTIASSSTETLFYADAYYSRIGIGTTTASYVSASTTIVVLEGGMCVDDDQGASCGSRSIPPGTIQADGAITASAFDLAEVYHSEGNLPAGTVVRVSAMQSTSTLPTVAATEEGYDARMVGVVSTNPGLVLGWNSTTTDVAVALAGRVPVKVTDENGPIEAGDAITSSARFPGYAMRSSRSGRILGHALQGVSFATSTPDVPYTVAPDGVTRLAKINVFMKIGWEAAGPGSDIVLDVGAYGKTSGALLLQNSRAGIQVSIATSSAALLVNQTVSPSTTPEAVGNLLQVQANGIDKLAVSGFGATTISANLNCADLPGATSTCPALLAVSNNGSEYLTVTATGTVAVAYDLKVGRNLAVGEHIHAGADVAGQVILPAGEIATSSIFAVPYVDTPIITLTPNGRVGSEYWVENVAASEIDSATTSTETVGFRVNIDKSTDHPVVFNYIIVGTSDKVAPLAVVDASRVSGEIVVTPPPANTSGSSSVPDAAPTDANPDAPSSSTSTPDTAAPAEENTTPPPADATTQAPADSTSPVDTAAPADITTAAPSDTTSGTDAGLLTGQAGPVSATEPAPTTQ